MHQGDDPAGCEINGFYFHACVRKQADMKLSGQNKRCSTFAVFIQHKSGSGQRCGGFGEKDIQLYTVIKYCGQGLCVCVFKVFV